MYSHQEKRVKALVKKAKIDYEIKLASNVKENPKSFFGYIRGQHKGKDTVGPLRDNKTGEMIEEYEVMANTLNEFFVSVFTSEDSNIPVLADRLDDAKHMKYFDVTEDEIEKQLIKLKEGKAPGPDNITVFS